MLLVGYVALSYLWEYDHISKCLCGVHLGDELVWKGSTVSNSGW